MSHDPPRQPATASLPRRGGPFVAWGGRLFLRLSGWRIVGQLPEVPKLLIIVAPHTSNWDFVFGIAAVFALRLDARWVGKHTLFRAPLGPLMRWLGGIPVDRRRPQGVVGELVGAFRSRERLLLGITPEGTRSRVERWKTGFYQVARQAEVPLVPACLDYRLRRIVLGAPFVLTGDLDADFARLQTFFAAVTPRHPDKFNPQIR